MLTKEQLIKFSLYPVKALTSKRFYFEVLFSMKGLGFLYLLALCVVLAVPSTIKINSVLNTFKDIELPRLIASIPPSYLTRDGVLIPTNPNEGYKELRTSQGVLAIVYNVNDEPLKNNSELPVVELSSRQIVVRSPQKSTVLNYSELVTPDTSFNPLEVSNMVEAIFGVAGVMLFVFLVGWFFCVLVFNALVIALLSKFLFLLVGKMKTSFTNTLRLSSFANTIVGLLLLIELVIDVKISFSLIMLTPLVYMMLFIKSFRQELEDKGLSNFVKNYTPEGTTVKKYDEDGNSIEPRKDVSDFTDGLNSTSNMNKDEIKNEDDEPVSKEDSGDLSDDSFNKNKNKQQSNKKDNDSNDDGPGIFTP